ncbi:MAG: cytochrome C oxidase subunit IV family protein, partial [Gammaproteobacteria bacterium]|nr:cytochrome C oxidase subunit IV family protein [Gammaproteobacteria bacterium]
MQQSIETHSDNATAHTHAKTNPILVYVILAAFTLIEVTVTITGGLPRQTLIPVLLSISFVKASLVALYYMHLRYEKAIYGFVFIIPAA